MNRSHLPFMPQFFDRYINLIDKDLDHLQALSTFDAQWLSQFQADFEALGNQVYAPGKWTVKDILQHLIDTERVLTYRALSIARGDKVALPGFDEETFARNTTAQSRSVKDLLEEFDIVRQSSILMFRNMTDGVLLNVGTASEKPISSLALALTVTGHVVHHVNVIRERYLPLIND
jgi:hypothetical protein